MAWMLTIFGFWSNIIFYLCNGLLYDDVAFHLLHVLSKPTRICVTIDVAANSAELDMIMGVISHLHSVIFSM